MTRSDWIAILALVVSGMSVFLSLRDRWEARHLVIVEQRNATIGRFRALKRALEKAKDQLLEVLKLPLPERELDQKTRQRFEKVVSEFGDVIGALELGEKLLNTTGHTLHRATHKHALDIKNLLHGANGLVESSEDLLGSSTELLEYSKTLAHRNKTSRRRA